MTFPTDPNLIVGLERADDAGVYRLTDDIAIIQTVDFFTPIVDDPFAFGRIAAANALSDIYAMGGVPKTAMNLVAFPIKEMDIDVLRRILEGGLDKMAEAGVVLAGGHSVEDSELKYGLSVTGLIHPDRVLVKKNLKRGDRLVLTKPLGTGIINTAIKGGLASTETIDMVTAVMAQLNRRAAEAMDPHPVHACTDITGFGFLGHLAEMVLGSGCGVRIEAGAVPLLPGAMDFAAMGLFPAGAFKNKEFHGAHVTFDPSVDPVLQDMLFDPQTSGGLLIGVEERSADALLSDLRRAGVDGAAVVGEVLTQPVDKIVVV